MKQQEDVLVIGGGVIGVCAAYYVAEQGRQVTVLDKGEICSGASYGNAGLIVPSHSIPLAAPGVLKKGLKWMLDAESPFYIKPRFKFELLSWLWKFRANCKEDPMRRGLVVLRDMSRASIELYEQLSAVGGLEFNYTQSGLLALYSTQQGYEEGVKKSRLLHEVGIDSKSLDTEQVRAMAPNVLATVVGGIYFPEDAYLIPDEFVRALANKAEEMGVRIKTSTEVLEFETSGRKISTVKTTRGDFQPEHVVLAAGAWSSSLAKELRIKLPIQPAKGYSITVKRPETSPTIPVILSEAKVAITPLDGALRFAGTLELSGLEFSINRRRVDAILQAIRDCHACGGWNELIEIWRGLRPCTPDGLPIIGRSAEYENLIYAAGHAMKGMCLGPVTGKLVSQLVSDKTPLIDMTALSLERFR